MVLMDGSTEAIEAAAIVGAHLDAWAASAGGGGMDHTWQPLEYAPRGATRVAEGMARALAHHYPVDVDVTKTSAEGWRAIARGLAVIAYDLGEHAPAQQMAADFHALMVSTARALDGSESTTRHGRPESTLAIPDDLTDADALLAKASLDVALRLAGDLTAHRIATATPGEQQEVLTLVLGGLRRAPPELDAWPGAVESVAIHDRAAAPRASDAYALTEALTGANWNTPTKTLVAASESLAAIWGLMLDFLIGMAERLRSGPRCAGYLTAAAGALTQCVQASSRARALTDESLHPA